ncbi:MAG: hypothetical protein ACLGI5_04810 [Thermoleophilia bacterium]
MLFDLRGRGRRRTVQAIYLSLAILMGGGLVLFGIGSDTGGGGLVDGLVGDGGGDGSVTESLDEEIDEQLARVRANPRDADAWAELAIARFRRAGIDGIQQNGAYTDEGKQRLQLAATAWERHLALEPEEVNVRAANLMVQAYGAQGLNQLDKAVRAKQIVTEAADPPSSNLYAQLAVLAYQAGDNRTGDLAGNRAVELAPQEDRKELRSTLDLLKQQSAAERAQQQSATTPAG